MSFESGHGLVNFSGLASGLDTPNIIKAMVASAHIPIDNLRAREDIVKAHQGIYDRISSLMQSLGSMGQELSPPTQFMQLSAKSSNATVVAAAVGTGATAGSYSVTVQKVAAAQKTYSTGVSSATTVGLVGTGSITMQIGSATPIPLIVDDTTTLQDVANAINTADVAATASLVFDGTNYRLQITGDNTGAVNNITFVESGTTLGLADTANTPQAAQDATLLIDNVVTVTSATNTVSGAIAGVTFQVNSYSTTPQEVTIAVDAELIGSSVKKFIEAYNDVVKAINADAMYGGAVDPRKLVGDSTLQNLTLQMQSVITSPISGATGTYHALSQLGVATQRDGTLALDESVLKSALAADPLSVSRVFTNDPTSGTQGVAYQMSKLADVYAIPGLGILSQISTSMDAETRGMDNRVAHMEENLALYEQNLQAQFYRLELVISRLKAQGAYIERNIKDMNSDR